MINIPTHSTTLFTFSNKTFVTEASNFRLAPNGITGQIFEDSCDEGFQLLSHLTGKTEMFFLENIKRTTDGEVLAEIFVPVNRELRAHGIEVHILND